MTVEAKDATSVTVYKETFSLSRFTRNYATQLGILGVFIELKTPGFGIPGICGLVLLAIFFLGHYVAGLAGVEENCKAKHVCNTLMDDYNVLGNKVALLGMNASMNFKDNIIRNSIRNSNNMQYVIWFNYRQFMCYNVHIAHK